MKILLEYVIVFVLVFFINLFLNKFNENYLKPELVYLKKIYKINIRKNKINNFKNIVLFINSFIITTIYIILVYLVKGLLLKIIIGTILMILLMIICYGLLARYYLKKEGN